MTVDDANSDSISNQVIQINRKTGETQTIFKSHYEVAATQGLQTSKQWIVWVDGDDFGENTTLYAFNEKTEETMAFGSTDVQVSKEFPVLAGDYVAWTEHTKKTNDTSMIVYDLSHQQQKTAQPIQNFEWLNADYSIHDHSVIYVEKTHNQATIKRYDIATDRVTTYPTKETAIGWPTMLNANTIAYVAYDDEEQLEKNHLMIYDMKEKRTRNAFPNEKTVDIAYLKKYDTNVFLTVKDEQLYTFTQQGQTLKKQQLDFPYNFAQEDITYANNEFFILRHDIDSTQYELIIEQAVE